MEVEFSGLGLLVLFLYVIACIVGIVNTWVGITALICITIFAVVFMLLADRIIHEDVVEKKKPSLGEKVK